VADVDGLVELAAELFYLLAGNNFAMKHWWLLYKSWRLWTGQFQFSFSGANFSARLSSGAWVAKQRVYIRRNKVLARKAALSKLNSSLFNLEEHSSRKPGSGRVLLGISKKMRSVYGRKGTRAWWVVSKRCWKRPGGWHLFAVSALAVNGVNGRQLSSSSPELTCWKSWRASALRWSPCSFKLLYCRFYPSQRLLRTAFESLLHARASHTFQVCDGLIPA